MDRARLNGLSLFSGIGGIDLALHPWVRTIAYCESDRYAQAVLLSRMSTGDLDIAPIWSDVRTLTKKELGSLSVDIIHGGFPCQDLSVAGLGKGLAGERSGLFFEIERLCREMGPRFVFLENVPPIRSRGADVVVGRLAQLGYDCRWGVLSAFDVGAPHLRERWWLLAYRNGDRLEELPQRDGEGQEGGGQPGRDADRLRDAVSDAFRDQLRDQPRWRGGAGRDGLAVPGDDGASQSLADSESVRERESADQADALATRGEARDEPFYGGPFRDPDRQSLAVGQGERGDSREEHPSPFGAGWWLSEPDVGRVAHGVPHRVDRLRALGNGVVPACAREAFQRLSGLKPGWRY